MYDLEGFLVFGFCGNEFVVALKRLLMFYIGTMCRLSRGGAVYHQQIC